MITLETLPKSTAVSPPRDTTRMSELRLGAPETQSDEGIIEGIALWRGNADDAVAEGDEAKLTGATQALQAFQAEAGRRGLPG